MTHLHRNMYRRTPRTSSPSAFHWRSPDAATPCFRWDFDNSTESIASRPKNGSDGNDGSNGNSEGSSQGSRYFHSPQTVHYQEEDSKSLKCLLGFSDPFHYNARLRENEGAGNVGFNFGANEIGQWHWQGAGHLKRKMNWAQLYFFLAFMYHCRP